MFNDLLFITFQGSILAIFVFCITFFGHGVLSANVRFFLWAIVIVRFLLPVSLTSPYSVFGLFTPKPKPEIVALPDRSAPQSTIEMPLQQIAPKIIEPTQPTQQTPPVAIVEPRRKPLVIPWLAMIVALWCCGTLYGIGRLVQSEFALRKKRKNWTEIDSGPLWNLVQDCRRELGLGRRIRIFLTSEKLGAASLGIAQPAIVLSEDMEKSFSLVELRLIVLHELMHHKRFDPLTNLLGRIVVAVHWPNPFAYLASSRMRTERELAVDELMIRKAAWESACVYSDVILKTARQYALVLPSPNLLGVQSLDQFLERRITMILSKRKTTILSTFIGIILISLLISTGLTNAKPLSRATQTPETEEHEKAKIAISPDVPKITLKGKVLNPDGSPADRVTVNFISVDVFKSPSKAELEKQMEKLLKQGIDRKMFDKIHEASMRQPPAGIQGKSIGSDKEGNFELDAIIRPGANVLLYAFSSTLPRKLVSEPVVFLSEKDRNDITIQLKEGVPVWGKVVFDDGKPAFGRTISGIRPISPLVGSGLNVENNFIQNFQTRTDASGEYVLYLPVGGEFKIKDCDEDDPKRITTLHTSGSENSRVDIKIPIPIRGLFVKEDGSAPNEVRYMQFTQQKGSTGCYKLQDTINGFEIPKKKASYLSVLTKDNMLGAVYPIPDDQQAEFHKVVLKPTATVKLRFVDPKTKKAVEGKYCSVATGGYSERSSSTTHDLISSAISDEKGVVVFKLPPGTGYYQFDNRLVEKIDWELKSGETIDLGDIEIKQ